MTKATRVAQTMLLAATTVVLAQHSHAQPVSHGGEPPQVLSATGSMYNGNNVNLHMPAEPNSYWLRLWSGAGLTGSSASSSASGTGSASGANIAPAAAEGQH